MTRSKVWRIVLPLVLVASACGRKASLDLKEFGSFHIGGRSVEIKGKPLPKIELTPGVPGNIDPNGTYTAEQMYVQYFVPANGNGKLPLLMWHGAWLTGATWETTPDGREGWLHYFLRRGWTVYNSDAVERGRAGWSPTPEIYSSDPIWLTKENAIERFRIPKSTQFPKEALDQFVKQAVPRWTTNNKATVAAYLAEVDKVCPCAVMVHSQSGQFGAAVAEARPDKVKALIMIEPANGGDLANASKLKNTPVLAVYGDNMDARWAQIRAVGQRYYDAVTAAGGRVEVIDLPKRGITGNSHMMMMDRNSDQVAGLIEEWLGKI